MEIQLVATHVCQVSTSSRSRPWGRRESPDRPRSRVGAGGVMGHSVPMDLLFATKHLRLQSYLLRCLDPPGTHPSPTFSEGTWSPRGPQVISGLQDVSFWFALVTTTTNKTNVLAKKTPFQLCFLNIYLCHFKGPGMHIIIYLFIIGT